MIALSPKREGCLFILKQIGLEAVLLFADPGEGQADGKKHFGIGQAPDVQFPCNGCQCQDIIILVVHLVGGEFLVLIPDDIIPPLINQHIALEGGFLVVDGHAGLETGVGRLDVPVSVVDADDHGLVVHSIIHSFPPYSAAVRLCFGIRKGPRNFLPEISQASVFFLCGFFFCRVLRGACVFDGIHRWIGFLFFLFCSSCCIADLLPF